MSYRNIYYNGREHVITLFTWDKEGKRIQVPVTHDPYIYLEGPGDAKSIFDTKLIKKTFRKQFDRFQFLRDSKIKRVFENLNITQQYLVDTFWKENEKAEFTSNPVKTLFLDIEVHAPDEFPVADQAKHPVNVITVYDTLTNKFTTWGLGAYKNEDKDVTYVHCKTEKEILIKFIEYLEKDYPDILSGWNSEFFDIPYIINRITNLLGEDFTKRLSPVSSLYSRVIHDKFGKDVNKWHIDGISLIDYLDVYKRFCLGVRESYKLNKIAEAELGEKKVDFGAINLATLADTDWSTFVKYNIQDVRLLVNLDRKLKYMELIRMLAYVGLTSFEGAMGTLSVINGATAIRARYRDQKIPTFIRDADDGSINPGAYVGEPLQGFQQNVISFDANSLYPNVMITLNMSMETKVAVITNETPQNVTIKVNNGKTVTLTRDKFDLLVNKEVLCRSKANVLFSQKKKGIVPEILDMYYKQRQEIKKDLKVLKQQYSEITNTNSADGKAVKLKIDQLDVKQLCIKVFINSIYGYFGNKHASFGDDDIASSVTLTGQSVIKRSNELLKEFIRRKTQITDEAILNNCIIYNDTDSSYVSIKPLVDAGIIKFQNGNKITKEAYDTVQEIEDFLNTEIKVWGASEFNSKDCRFLFKREAIADVGVFLEKKRYVLHELDDEGIACDKFKYTGVAVVRSTMPAAIKPYVKRIIETMLLTRNIAETNKVINETYDIFNKLPVEDITFVSNINNFEDYVSRCNGFTVGKKTPIHVKSSYYYNILIDRLNLANFEKIESGDKVRYLYVKKNQYNINSIAYKYYYPEEFKKIFEPDYEKMFEKHIFSVVDSFYGCVSWTPQKPGNEVMTDLFSALS